MLQYSSGGGKIAIIETLIEADADLNKHPPSLGDIREPSPFRALWMAVNASWSLIEPGHIEVDRLLLKHGADTGLPASRERHEENA